MDFLPLPAPLPGIHVLAYEDGLRIVSENVNLTGDASFIAVASESKSALGRSLPILIPQIIELDRAVLERSCSLLISYDNLHSLEEEGIRTLEGLAPWAPFSLEVHSTGSLGLSDFRYGYRFHVGDRQIDPQRFGAFASWSGKAYRMDHSMYSLLRALDTANAVAGLNEAGAGAWIRFSEIKGLAEEVGAQLDRYIVEERVVVPSDIGVGIETDANGRISLVPRVDGVDPEALKRIFLRTEGVSDIYSMDHPDGGRTRVVLGDRQKEAFRRMQRIRHVFGAEKSQVLSNPAAMFDGVAEVVNLGDLGPRVESIGKFPFVSRPYIGTTGVFDHPEGSDEKPPAIGIECQYMDGRRDRLEFKSPAEFKELFHQMRLAQTEGKSITEFHGVTITIDQDFVAGMEQLSKRITRPGGGARPTPEEKDGRYLLIYRNEDEVDYVEQDAGGPLTSFGQEIPKSFLDPSLLKDHQKQGIAWLEMNYALSEKGRRGCLLADDMGLGKTLQILAFLAWIIERGDLSPDKTSAGKPPWNPILVVAPVILLEDRTWLRDMEKFFEHGGVVFQPYLVLHGNELKKLRKNGAAGRETVVGEPVLDLDRIRQHQIVFTNYETVVNYQHSLARIKWTAVVTDEAQEYKTPSSKISHALKSLDPGYRVACTGTPVETRLLDLWNIFDFLQPGPLLGSKTDFSNKYEKPIIDEEAGRGAVLGELKDRLRFQKKDSYIMRREKALLGDLPKKHEHVIECLLSELQREMHEDFIARMRNPGDVSPLSMIHNMMYLYQHPELVRARGEVLRMSSKEIVDACPKLSAVIETLSSIRAKNEKVLIFTRSLVMQQVLAQTIRDAFGLEQVPIVNGGTKRNTETKSGADTRKGIIEKFKTHSGFNVIVLSPDVAGYGLTLTEANHVFHYGRWWNPAKEVQATDRVYRIGQDKDVHVYYPIAKDPRGEFKTFDEKLDALLARRRNLAKDFLMPVPDEDGLREELLSDILGKERTPKPSSSLGMNEVCLLNGDRFESLIALLERKKGWETIVTPYSGDQGMDLLARQGNCVRLLQCKHSSHAYVVEDEVLDEVLSAYDGYRARYFSGTVFALEAVVVTNGSFTEKTRRVAKDRGITLVGGTSVGKLLAGTPCTLGEVELAEESRCRSMKDVTTKINAWKR